MPVPGRDARDVFGRHAQQIFDLLGHLVGHGRRQIDLVDHRHDGQIQVQRGEEMGHGLGLDALGGVHHQHGAFAGLERTAHLVGKIHMARRVDQVDLILLAVAAVDHAHRAGLDGDALFPLQIHGVEELLAHLPLGDRVGHLHQTVGQGALAVVDVGNDRKIANVLFVHSADYKRARQERRKP